MKATTTERVIRRGSGEDASITIRVHDQGAGPYLIVRGENLDPYNDETPHDIILQSDEEIDLFAAECKAMLRQAEGNP